MVGRFDGMESDAAAHLHEEAVVAVLQLHQMTLEAVSFDGPGFLLGDAFVQACLRQQRLCSVGDTRFAPETSLSLLEDLYRHHEGLGASLLRHALLDLHSHSVRGACMFINGDIVGAHIIQKCPNAMGVDFKKGGSSNGSRRTNMATVLNVIFPFPSAGNSAMEHKAAVSAN